MAYSPPNYSLARPGDGYVYALPTDTQSSVQFANFWDALDAAAQYWSTAFAYDGGPGTANPSYSESAIGPNAAAALQAVYGSIAGAKDSLSGYGKRIAGGAMVNVQDIPLALTDIGDDLALAVTIPTGVAIAPGAYPPPDVTITQTSTGLSSGAKVALGLGAILLAAKVLL